MTRATSTPIPRRTFGLVALAVVALAAPSFVTADEITIRIAPNTLNLRSHGTVVTVHTDVPYGSVDVYSVYLGGVAINAWKADDRGNFVAKFVMDEIKGIDGLVLNELNTFQFVALTIYNEPIWGEADIMVIDRGPYRSGGAARAAAD